MDALSRISSSVLEEELTRRKSMVATLPALLPKRNEEKLEYLGKLADTYLRHLVDPEVYAKDTEHYMFEAVMEMLYGPTVWEFINPNLR